MAAPPAAKLVLDESIGFSGPVRRGLHAHPGMPGRMLFVGGGCIVMSEEDGRSQETFLRGHDHNISCLAISPITGRQAVSGQTGHNADVIVWDTAARRIQFRLSEHDSGVSCLAFSPDERLLVSIGDTNDKRVFVWDTATGAIVASGTTAPRGASAHPILSVAWSPVTVASGGTYTFATAGPKGVLHWTLDPRAGALGCELLSTASVHRLHTSVAFSPDGALVHAGTESGDIMTWVLRTGIMTDVTPVVCTKGIPVLTALGDGRLLVGGGDGSVAVVTPGYREPTPMGATSTQPATDHLLSAAGRRDSVHKQIYGLPNPRGGKDSGPVRAAMVDPPPFQLGKAGTRDIPRVTLVGGITSISCTADGRAALVGTAHSFMVYVRLADMQPLTLREGHRGPILGLSFPADRSDLVVSCSVDGSVRSWNLDTFSQVAAGHVSAKDAAAAVQVQATCVAVQGDVAISGWTDGHLRCHQYLTGKLVWEMPHAHPKMATAIAAAPGAPFAVTGGEDGEVRIWDTLSRKLVVHLKEHAGPVTDVHITPDGSRALSCSKDRSLFSWDVGRKCRTSVHTQRLGHMNGLAVAPDGLLVVTVGQDKRIVLWDLRQTAALSALDGAHAAEGTCAAISPSGALLATGGADMVVRLWELDTGRLLAEGAQHAAPVTSVKFSPDGARLCSAGQDGMIMSWKVPRG